jgi:glutamate formiminotransferase/formiminotetrahydrofolate cyclodeaminase
MDRLVECVPNFSEGVDRDIIDQILDAIVAVAGVRLLDVFVGRDTNRTVATFVGEPESVVEAAFQAIACAASLVDMRRHKGVHPRIGATDVCPIVPICGMTLAACAFLAETLAARVGDQLGIPVYLYGAAAGNEARVRLPDIRKGEYEGLEKKLADPAFEPDFGPAVFNPRAGATVIGARDFLVAYNVNLDTRDQALARQIALTIRETGRFKRDANYEIVKDENGISVRQPGVLKHCQAAGWTIDEYGLAQVTTNLTNFRETGLHDAYEAVRAEALRLGLQVAGSEVVGLLPKQAMVDAGRFYLRKASVSDGVSEEEIIHAAIRAMGLHAIADFNHEEKIIEYALEKGVSLRE